MKIMETAVARLDAMSHLSPEWMEAGRQVEWRYGWVHSQGLWVSQLWTGRKWGHSPFREGVTFLELPPHTKYWLCISRDPVLIISQYLNLSIRSVILTDSHLVEGLTVFWVQLFRQCFVLGGLKEFFPSRLLGISSPSLGTSCYLRCDSVEKSLFSDWLVCSPFLIAIHAGGLLYQKLTWETVFVFSMLDWSG